MDVFATLYHILGIYALLLIIFGTSGNVLSFVVCLRPNLRKVPTFVYLSFMLFTDTMALFFWNLNHFVQTFYGFIFEGINIHWCRLFSIMQLTTFQSSAWLLVAMTVERYLSVRFKNWRTVHFNPKKAAITAAMIVIMAVIFNVHQGFTINYEMPLNKTIDNGCYVNLMHQFWQHVHIYFYSIIPFIILLVTNMLLVYETSVRSNKVASTANRIESKHKAMSFTIFMMTIAFVALTLPSTIAGGYFLNELLSNNVGYTILFFCDSFTYSYHGLNFIVFLLTNKQFSREFKNLVYKLISFGLKTRNETIGSTIESRISSLFTHNVVKPQTKA